MSISVSGPPYYFWTNRYVPWFVGSMQTASSGKVALVRTALVGLKGKPMHVRYRMMTPSQLETWAATTDVFSMFGHQVIWSFNNPFPEPRNEILSEADPGYLNGGVLDYYQGEMNLIIVS